jgi:hypothetical protein
MTAAKEALAAELLIIHSDYVAVMGLTEGMGHVDATSVGDLKRLDAAHIAVAAIFEEGKEVRPPRRSSASSLTPRLKPNPPPLRHAPDANDVRRPCA